MCPDPSDWPNQCFHYPHGARGGNAKAGTRESWGRLSSTTCGKIHFLLSVTAITTSLAGDCVPPGAGRCYLVNVPQLFNLQHDCFPCPSYGFVTNTFSVFFSFTTSQIIIHTRYLAGFNGLTEAHNIFTVTVVLNTEFRFSFVISPYAFFFFCSLIFIWIFSFI